MSSSLVPPSVLGIWKEIAAFFGKGTRTGTIGWVAWLVPTMVGGGDNLT